MLLASRVLTFQDFWFKVPTRELLRTGADGSATTIPLGLRAADLLLLFLERPGELITKDEIMDAVWPGVAVEESNLTVQISAIRRALDAGRSGESSIQNVPRRGYRFTLAVEEAEGERAPVGEAGLPSITVGLSDPVAPTEEPETGTPAPARRFRRYGEGLAAIACAALLVVGWLYIRADHSPDRTSPSIEPPRLSIVALPFVNAGGEPRDDELAAALTEDVTTSLAQTPGAAVVAPSMAQSTAARKLLLPTIGRELGVRYVLEGTIRRSAGTIELTVQLSNAARGTSVWAGQFLGSAGEAREQIKRNLLFKLRTAFMDVEAARLSTLPLSALNVQDLLLKARAAINHQPTPARSAENIATLERALGLDPNSAEVMITLAFRYLLAIVQHNLSGPSRDEYLQRARVLADRARALAAGSESMLNLQALFLRVEGRYEEAVAAYRVLTLDHPTRAIYHLNLARNLILVGRSAEAASLLQQAIRLNAGELPLFVVYGVLGQSLIRLGRDDEAVDWLRAAKEQSAGFDQISQWLAIAYAHTGKIDDAQRELRESMKLRPTLTLRGRRHEAAPTAAAAEEQRREVEGLAIAGLRDHVPEDADEGLPVAIGPKSNWLIAPTPAGAQGVSTIRTSELSALIDRANGESRDPPPLLLSAMCPDCFDIAFPGAIDVPVGVFREPMNDDDRRAFKAWLDPLLGLNQTRHLITVSWNAERWNARNLALELVALGYPNVSWYRGGLEAWDAAGLPVRRRH
jgi:adenylate cyclase